MGSGNGSLFRRDTEDKTLERHPHNQQSAEGQCYEIKVRGELDEAWEDWFHGMTITVSGNMTTIRGTIIDQAALRGILSKIWDLNLTLIAVNILDKET
jgi:hypothetical protein